MRFGKNEFYFVIYIWNKYYYFKYFLLNMCFLKILIMFFNVRVDFVVKGLFSS